MAFTLGQLVDAARDLHPAFGPERTPPALARRLAARRVRALIGRVLTLAPDALAVTEVDEPLPLADHAAGVALPTATMQVRSVEVQTSSSGAVTGRDVPLVPAPQRLTTPRWPACWVDGLAGADPRVRLLGGSDEWTGYDTVVVRVVEGPLEIAGSTVADAAGGTDSTTLPLPDDALLPLALAVAADFARRLPDAKPPVSVADYAPDAEAEEVKFLTRLAMQAGPTTLTIQDVR